MGKNEDLGARGSSDKPSSFDVYIELKTNGGASRTLHAVKVKGEKGDDQVEFEIVGTTLEDGQKTAYVRWGQWNHLSDAAKSLNGNARLLFACLRDVIACEGEMRELFHSEPPKRCVQKAQVWYEFCQRHKESKRHDMAFKRSWQELVGAGLVTVVRNENRNEMLGELADWVYLEKE
jgi:hypothetical protein